MNIYELLKNELNSIGDKFNTKDKVDYIYIRLCSIFNYNEKWLYSDNQDVKNSIFDEEIDIFNVKNKKLVCSSFSRLFTDLCNILLFDDINFDMAYLDGYDSHVFSVVIVDNTYYEYDPLRRCNDFLNVKKKLPVRGVSLRGARDIFDYEDDYELENKFRRIGYVADYVGMINDIKELIDRDNYDGFDLFKYLVDNLNIDGLGIEEVRNYFNTISVQTMNKGFKDLGVKFTSIDTGNMIKYLYRLDDEEYLSEEVDSKVVFVKKRGE